LIGGITDDKQYEEEQVPFFLRKLNILSLFFIILLTFAYGLNYLYVKEFYPRKELTLIIRQGRYEFEGNYSIYGYKKILLQPVEYDIKSKGFTVSPFVEENKTQYVELSFDNVFSEMSLRILFTGALLDLDSGEEFSVLAVFHLEEFNPELAYNISLRERSIMGVEEY
jgi:hypothetical protein